MRVYIFLIFGAVVCCDVVHGATFRSNDTESLDLITHIRKLLPGGNKKPVYLLSIERLPEKHYENKHASKTTAQQHPSVHGKSDIMSPPERHQPPLNENDPPEMSTAKPLLNKDRLIAKKIKFALYRKTQPYLRYRPNTEGHESLELTLLTGEPIQASHHLNEFDAVNVRLSPDKKHNQNKDPIALNPIFLGPVVGGDHIGNRNSLPANDGRKPVQSDQSWNQNRRHQVIPISSHYSRPHDNRHHHHSSHRHHYKSKDKHRRPADADHPYHIDEDSNLDDHHVHSIPQHSETLDEGENINDSYADNHEKPIPHGSHHSFSSIHTSHKHRPHRDEYGTENYDVEDNSSKQSFDNSNQKPDDGEGDTTEVPQDDDLSSNVMHDDSFLEDHNGQHQQHGSLSNSNVTEGQHNGDDYKAGHGIRDDKRKSQHLANTDEKQDQNNGDILDGSQENDWNSPYAEEANADEDNEYQPDQHESTSQHMHQSDKDKVQNSVAENYDAYSEADPQNAPIDAAPYPDVEINAQESETPHQQSEDYRPTETNEHQHNTAIGDGQPPVSSHIDEDTNLPDEETYDPIDNEEDAYQNYPTEHQLYSNENYYSQHVDDWDPYNEEGNIEEGEDDYTPSYSHADGYYPEEYDENDYYNSYPPSKPSQSQNTPNMATQTIENLHSSANVDQFYQDTVTQGPSPQKPISNENNTTKITVSSNNNSPENQDSLEVAPASGNVESPVTPGPPEPQEIDPDVAPSPQEQEMAPPENPQRPPESHVQGPTIPAYRPPPSTPTYTPLEDYDEQEADEEDIDEYYEENDTAPSAYEYYNSYPSGSQDNLSTPSYYEGYETGYEASSPSVTDYPSSAPSYEERSVGESKRKLRSKLRKRRRRSPLRLARKLV